MLSCRRPLLRWRLPSATLGQTVQTFGLEAVLALAWLPYVLCEGAAGRHGCWSSEAAGRVSGQESPP